MSDAAVMNYVPEEHAPDPIGAGKGDPVTPGRLAIWLFLASEIMFFIGLLGTYIVLRSGSPRLFESHGMMLNKWLAGINTLVLIFSSLTMALSVDAAQKGDRKRLIACLALTLLMAFGFMGIKFIEYSDKFHHYTILAKEGTGKTAKSFIYDGHVHDKSATINNHLVVPAGATWVTLADKVNEFEAGTSGVLLSTSGDNARVRFDVEGTPEATVPAALTSAVDKGDVKETWKVEHATRREVPRDEDINVHYYSPAVDDKLTGGEGHSTGHAQHADYELKSSDINKAVWYGPQKSIFYSCYFALTGVHGLHVVGGMVPLALLLIQGIRGKLFPAHTEYVGLYWHFVDLVWIFLFPLMYLI